MEQYWKVPSEIFIQDILSKSVSFSPGMYRGVHIGSSNVKPLSELLDHQHAFDKGEEPGSMWYLQKSDRFLMRTKVLQEYTALPYPHGDSITPINPRAFVNQNLFDGDILMSKDSNVGECAILKGEGWEKYMFSSGIVRLHPAIDRYYLFSFLKHPIFKAQLLSKLPRGATILHAKTLWLNCLIPLPTHEVEKTTKHISALMQAIVEKEAHIRDRAGQFSRQLTTSFEHTRKNPLSRSTILRSTK